jgi:hypothetical protein
MRHSPYPSIIRLSARPRAPSTQDSSAAVTRRPRGTNQPHPDAKVAEVRRLIEETTLTYQQISAKTGVDASLACRWRRDQNWLRPLLAPRATDSVPSERAGAKLRRRTLAIRLSALAERAIRELEASASVDLDKLTEATELLKMAKLAAGPRRRRSLAIANGEEPPPLFDAEPRNLRRALRAAGIRTERTPEEALVDFIISRAPPPTRLTKQQRQHKRMMERER